MKRRDLLLSAPALVSGSVLTGLSSTARAETAVVKFGQSASLTGGQASYGKDVRDGIAAALAAASKAGGTRFELVTLDDGGDKERCKQNVKALLDAGVAGLVGFTSGAATEASISEIENAQIALLGTASGNMGIRSSKLSTAFHVRAGYDDEYRRMVTYVKEFGMRRVGYVYLKDTSQANQAAMNNALQQVDLKLTETVALDRNAKSFEADAAKLLAARLDCVLFTTNAAPIISIVNHMSLGKYPGMYFSSSFAGQSLIDAMTDKGQSIIMTQVVPRPNSTALSVVKRCREDLAALDGKTRMGFTSLEGYIAGMVAVEAARAALKGGGVNRSRFKEALAGLRTDLGGYKVQFSSSSTDGSHFVDVVAIDRYGRIIG